MAINNVMNDTCSVDLKNVITRAGEEGRLVLFGSFASLCYSTVEPSWSQIPLNFEQADFPSQECVSRLLAEPDWEVGLSRLVTQFKGRERERLQLLRSQLRQEAC